MQDEWFLYDFYLVIFVTRLFGTFRHGQCPVTVSSTWTSSSLAVVRSADLASGPILSSGPPRPIVFRIPPHV